VVKELFLTYCWGIVGAIIGGWLLNAFGHVGVTGLNLYSIVVATLCFCLSIT